MNTCVMCHSLYVKANGELPCWDDAGEQLILRTLDITRLKQGMEAGIFFSPELQHIRQSFLLGEDPHSEFCRRCAVRGYGGGHNSLQPATMELLHLEASYLCHLSCPQCIPASARHKLKAPPYHMSPSFLEALLQQLRREGVENIKVVHFEGRGDPLMNPDMGELVAVTKAAYPKAFTMATTHGSYPYKSWIVESGLDLLRVSIDGAFPQNYQKYRVGGDFETVLAFLRGIRNDKRRRGRHLQIEWKYILFEWNDTDEEMARAAHLADELDVSLRFVLTHSPGKSRRFPDSLALKTMLPKVASKARTDTTFQLKQPSQRYASVDAVKSEEVMVLCLACLDAIRHHNDNAAFTSMIKLLEYDPGIQWTGRLKDCKHLLNTCLPEILAKAKFPGTLSGLSGIAQELGCFSNANRLFRRYLWLATKEDLHKRERLAAIQHGAQCLRAVISLRFRIRRLLSKVFTRNAAAENPFSRS